MTSMTALAVAQCLHTQAHIDIKVLITSYFCVVLWRCLRGLSALQLPMSRQLILCFYLQRRDYILCWFHVQ